MRNVVVHGQENASLVRLLCGWMRSSINLAKLNVCEESQIQTMSL